MIRKVNDVAQAIVSSVDIKYTRLIGCCRTPACAGSQATRVLCAMQHPFHVQYPFVTKALVTEERSEQGSQLAISSKDATSKQRASLRTEQRGL